MAVGKNKRLSKGKKGKGKNMSKYKQHNPSASSSSKGRESGKGAPKINHRFAANTAAAAARRQRELEVAANIAAKRAKKAKEDVEFFH